MPLGFSRRCSFCRVIFPIAQRQAIELLESRRFLSAAPVDSGLPEPLFEIATASDDEPAAGLASPPGTTPTQMRHAYGVDSISFLGGTVVGTGAGQTIGIIDAYDNPKMFSSGTTGYATSDLALFSSYYGLPQFGTPGAPTFTKVNQTGGTSYPGIAPTSGSNWALEIALDVEWAHVIAPMANIMLVEATDNGSTIFGVSNLQTAVKYAATHGCSTISMSYGGTESQSKDSSRDPDFLQSGVTYFASTGDGGAPGEYPADSPNVVAVGGTSLFLNGNNYSSEDAWAGSGGGISQFEAKPSYQNGITNISNPSNHRMIPDISFDADPNTGVPVYDTFNDNAATPWEQIGGTSLSSPCWAALMAIADQGRVANGLGTLSGGTTLSYLYKMSANSFHDVTTGSNGNPAGPGYDLVTGIGTPLANIVIPELANPSPTPTTPTLAMTAASDSGTSNSDRVTKITTPTFTGHTGAYANINLYIGSTLVAQGSSDASGNYSLASPAQTDGTYSYTVTASDISGTSPTSSTVSVTIDTTAPTLINPGNQTFTIVNTAGTTINFAKVTANDVSPAHPTVTSSKNSPSSFLPGTTTITASATDAAGNTSGTTSFTVTLVDPVFISRGNGAAYGFNSSTLSITAGVVTFIADSNDTKPGLTVNVNGSNSTLTVNAAQHLAGLNLSNSTATINGTADINIADSMSWSGGTMSGTGKTIIANGASLTFSSATVKNLSREIDNNGTASWTGGNIKFNGGSIYNNFGGIFDAYASYDGINNGLMSSGGGTNSFNNAGNYEQTTDNQNSASDFRIPFVNSSSGIVTTDPGTNIYFYSGGSSSGTFTSNGATYLESVMTLGPSDAISGTGRFVLDASLTVGGTVSSLAELDINSPVTVTFSNAVSMDSSAGLIKTVASSSGIFNGNVTTHAVEAHGDGSFTFKAGLSADTVLITDAGSHINFNGSVSSAPTLEIDNGASASIGQGGGKVLRFGQLTMGGTASIDLNDNAMIYDATGSTPFGQIQSLVTSGFNSGSWTGNGFNSTVANGVFSDGLNFHKTAIGFVDSSQSANSALFAGQPLTGPAILIGYTYYGDADLSGSVDSSDFTRLAANFGQTGQSWQDGDFNYDGTVNALDFNALASNYGSPSQSEALSSESSASAAAPLSSAASQQKPSLFNDDKTIESATADDGLLA